MWLVVQPLLQNISKLSHGQEDTLNSSSDPVNQHGWWQYQMNPQPTILSMVSQYFLWAKYRGFRFVMGVPPILRIIQVMDDHDLDLKQPWWLGDPPWLKKAPYNIVVIYIYIYPRYIQIYPDRLFPLSFQILVHRNPMKIQLFGLTALFFHHASSGTDGSPSVLLLRCTFANWSWKSPVLGRLKYGNVTAKKWKYIYIYIYYIYVHTYIHIIYIYLFMYIYIMMLSCRFHIF